MDERKKILLRSLLLTALIFTVGILLNHLFDVFRINTIVEVMQEHETSSEAYKVERFFTETFGGEACDVMIGRIGELKKEIRRVGEDLGSYSRYSFFRKHDFDYLKRKYFILQLRFYATIKKLNSECDKPYLPILFFYEIDDDSSERQGFILQDLSKSYEKQLVVLTIDKDYSDEPLVSLLVDAYNISEAPTMIIDSKKLVGLTYTGVLNATIKQELTKVDPGAQDKDFSFTPYAAGIGNSQLLAQMHTIKADETADPFARGDATLIAGRLTQNKTLICESMIYYDVVQPHTPEEHALLSETIASLDCGRNREHYLLDAATTWDALGNTYRAQILKKLSQGKTPTLIFDEHALTANTTVISGYKTPIEPNLSPTQAFRITLGTTTITLNKGDTLVTQDDRVYRDWLSGQLANPYGPQLLTAFNERLTYSQQDLRADIGWHEGGRVKDLSKLSLNHIPAVGTLVARQNDRWFAVDDAGIFRFEVPLDKILYPTTRFLTKDLAVLIDTHGVNTLVEQAIRYNAKSVMACCDHPGKIYAAQYLNEHGISTLCYTDKYAYLALGHNLDLIGSPPMTLNANNAVFGNQSITFTTYEPIVVVNATDDAYALWYYQTPASYFSALEETIPLNLHYVTLNDFNQMNAVVEAARQHNARIIATRVFTRDDYLTLKKWLQDPNHKAILFHTASYPYGQLLLREHPEQTSFDDPNPQFT